MTKKKKKKMKNDTTLKFREQIIKHEKLNNRGLDFEIHKFSHVLRL